MNENDYQRLPAILTDIFNMKKKSNDFQAFRSRYSKKESEKSNDQEVASSVEEDERFFRSFSQLLSGGAQVKKQPHHIELEGLASTKLTHSVVANRNFSNLIQFFIRRWHVFCDFDINRVPLEYMKDETSLMQNAMMLHLAGVIDQAACERLMIAIQFVFESWRHWFVDAVGDDRVIFEIDLIDDAELLYEQAFRSEYGLH